ncbi:MAG: LysM peptidoglycan-binding domain-containing protein [Bacteroidales bacterium]|nr:LysM peptidoglycan-binding domain-containing protein [Bacteroidales bacterium]
MKKILITLAISSWSALTAWSASSILDIKHSITDDNVIAPESFETKARELEENYYLQRFAARAEDSGSAVTGTPAEYEQLLSQLPTEIEMPYNSIVGRFIDMYLGKRRDLVADMLALHNYYGNIFIEELSREGIPLELQYLPVIESALNPNAVSKAGAVGLWQFMPTTATGMGLEVNSLVDQRRDPRLASRNAARYLRQLYDIYEDWSLAIAAYNCGPGNVNKALRRAGGGKKDFWEIYEYLLPETRGYVPAFIAANFVMNYYSKYGIRPTLVKQQLVTDTVHVANRVHFDQIAEVLNIPIDEIRMLNPQFRKDVIPGDNHAYALVLPSQQCLSYIMSEKTILDNELAAHSRRTTVEPGQLLADNGEEGAVVERLVTKTHVVKRGENLRDIAKKYGVSATDIKRWNKLRSSKVKAGAKLTIQVYEKVAAPADDVLLASNSSTASEPAATTSSSSTSSKKKTSTQASQSSSKSSSASASKSKSTSSKTTAKTYKVRKGDTLDKIARNHGVTIAALRKANGMSANASKITVGQTLKIPSK